MRQFAQRSRRRGAKPMALDGTGRFRLRTTPQAAWAIREMSGLGAWPLAPLAAGRPFLPVYAIIMHPNRSLELICDLGHESGRVLLKGCGLIDQPAQTRDPW